MGVDAQYRHLVSTPLKRSVLIVGAGPAGLFAAERLSADGHSVVVVDRMPSVGRKLLMAGRGGLNLTHSEPLKEFLARYGAKAAPIVGAIHGFRPHELIAWAEGLGQETFIGSSGRVFPKVMKASPLLRAWLARLRSQGVEIVTGERWIGWDEAGQPLFRREADGASSLPRARKADAVVLALGGGSWPRLGSDGTWTRVLVEGGVAISPWEAANAGVHVAWSAFIRDKFAGAPLKRLALSIGDGKVEVPQVLGEAIVTRTGLEGGAIYAIGAALRAALHANGGKPVTLWLDLKPGMTVAELARGLSKPRGKQTLANHLRKTVGLPPVMIAMLHEGIGRTLPADPEALAAAIKAVPIAVTGFAGLERAISSAGGIALSEIDANFMLVKKPGVFVAGEMLDWDAPTGGYLLQASFATGKAAAAGVTTWIKSQQPEAPSDGAASPEPKVA
jgi:uncharacterized flavoprotein (TIGR03862 family)